MIILQEEEYIVVVVLNKDQELEINLSHSGRVIQIILCQTTNI